MTAKKRWINKKFDKNDRLSQQYISWSSSDDEETHPNKRPKKVPMDPTSNIFLQSTQPDMLIGETYDFPLMNLSPSRQSSSSTNTIDSYRNLSFPLMNVSPLSQSSSFTNTTDSCRSLSPVLVRGGGYKRDTRQQNSLGTNVPSFELSPLLTKGKTTEKTDLNREERLHKSPVVVKVPLLANSPVLIRDKALEKYSKNALPISVKKVASKQSIVPEVQLHNSPVLNVPVTQQLINDETHEPVRESLLISSKQKICSGEQLYYSPLPESPLLSSTKPKKKYERNPSSDIIESSQSQHISAEDSVCNHIFDKNTPTKPSSTNTFHLDSSSQLIDSLSTKTSKGLINSATSSKDQLSIASSYYYEPPVRRKKYKKKGVMKFLQKVLTSQKTSLGIWRHEIALEGAKAVEPKEDVIRFKVQLIKREYGNTLLECSGTMGVILVAVSAIVKMDFVVDGEYLLFPPYQCRNVLYNSKETVCYWNSTRILRELC